MRVHDTEYYSYTNELKSINIVVIVYKENCNYYLYNAKHMFVTLQ